MNKFAKKGISALLLSGLTFGAYMGGTELVRDRRFAFAEDQVQASREDLKRMDDIAGVYRAVGRAVEPSVVSIEVHKTVKGVHNGLKFDDDILKKFFPDRDGDGEPDMPRGRGRIPMPNMPDDSDSMEQVAGGSGVIMEAADGKGYILTNNHVAGGADSMTVTLHDGRAIKKAKVLGTDPKSDLAVIQIEADKLIPAKWGDSDQLAKGDVIFAFGSPFGYIGSMTHGIVSALNRTDVGILSRQTGFAYENFIQVDAPINPGNSGGPLVNLRGEVVGINTAIASSTGSFNGIGFAIPSNQAKNAFGQLKDKGKVVRGFIGVGIQNMNPDMAKSFDYPNENGVLISDTYPDTPAFGKLKKGDIVSAIDGKPVKDSNQLRNHVAGTEPGKELSFTIFRKGKSTDVKIKIGEQPDALASLRGGSGTTETADSGDASSPAKTTAKALGLTLASPNSELSTRFNLEEDAKGVIVTNVDRRSPAARAGISPGDLITEIGDTTVETAKQAADALAKEDLSKGIRLSITTRQGSRFTLLKEEE